MTKEIPMEPNDDDHVPAGAYERCVDVLEMITDYLEGGLPRATVTLVDEHLSVCDGCRSVLDQWHTLVDLAGHVGTDDLDALEPATRNQLLEAFRSQRTQ
jgi:predicted anti-sigma-YlaC factor YlaD